MGLVVYLVIGVVVATLFRLTDKRTVSQARDYIPAITIIWPLFVGVVIGEALGSLLDTLGNLFKKEE